MTLEEKGLEYEVIEENLSELSPELLRLHPEGKVPLLIHGDQVIYESSIITEYLEETYPSPPLLPPSPSQRAKMRLWTHWCNQLLKPDLDAFKYEWATMSEDQKTELTARLHQHLDQLGQPLSTGPYLLGNELSLADIHVFPFYRQLQKANPAFPALFEKQRQMLDPWLERITSRPSFARVMEKKAKT
jgi:glutathione S-transferase